MNLEKDHLNEYKDFNEKSIYNHYNTYASRVTKLQRVRSTPIVHPDLHEDLTRWKSLTAIQVRWPTTHHRYHLDEGLAVRDEDTVCLSARDQRTRTSAGLHRSSAGRVVYSFSDREAALLDAEDIIRILKDKPPFGMLRHWNLDVLQKEFRRRWGRDGMWVGKRIPFETWLSCFRRTFEVIGTQNQYVRLKYQTQLRCVDNMDEVMINFARIKIPKLMRFQSLKLLNESEGIKIGNIRESAEHEVVTDLKSSYDVPKLCFPAEELEKFGVPYPPRVKETILN